MSPDARLTQIKKQCTALARQVDQAQAAKTEAEIARDKAEQALRSMDLQLAQTQTRLKLVEAELASLRPHRMT